MAVAVPAVVIEEDVETVLDGDDGDNDGDDGEPANAIEAFFK
jgi:hypothetical protein